MKLKTKSSDSELLQTMKEKPKTQIPNVFQQKKTQITSVFQQK